MKWKNKIKWIEIKCNKTKWNGRPKYHNVQLNKTEYNEIKCNRKENEIKWNIMKQK